MKKPLLIFLFFLLVPVFVFSKTYYIGVSLPLTGEFAPETKKMVNAIKLCADDMNRKGGFHGNIEVLALDDKNDPAEAIKVAEQLVKQENLIGVIGCFYSSTLEGGAMAVYDKAGVPVMSPYECNSDLEHLSKWEFNMNYSDAAQAYYQAVYAKDFLYMPKSATTNILIIHTSDAFGMGSDAAFEEKAKKIGLNVKKVLMYDHVKGFGNDFVSNGITQDELKEINVAVIYSHAASGVKLIKQLVDYGYKGTILGPTTFTDPRFLDTKVLEEKYSGGVYVTSPFLFETANEKAYFFKEDFKDKFNEDPSTTSAICYDAAGMLVDALIHKGYDHNAMREYLMKLNWQDSYEGLTGNLFFNKILAMDRDVYISHIEHGRYKVAFVQLLIPREQYVFAELPARIKKGQVIVEDNQPYHVVDVVFVGVDFIRINDIDTRSMAYEAELFLWFKWTGDRIDTKDIDILNIINRKENYMMKEDFSRYYKYRVMRMKSTFQAPFDLKKFPFDSQMLPLQISHRSKNSTHVMLVLDTRHIDFTPVREINPQEWTYVDKKCWSTLYKFDSTFGDPDYRFGANNKAKIYFSTVKANIEVQRIIFPYLFNLFLPLLIIIAVALFILNVPVDQHSIRIGSTTTALLAILVYYMAQKSALPRVGYLIKADYYFLVAFAFIITLMVGNLLVMNKFVKDKEKAVKFNKQFYLFFLPGTLLAYLLVTIFC